MKKKVFVSFPQEMVHAQKVQITEQLNNILEPIIHEVTGWNGFVDFTETSPESYALVAKCDNETLRMKMQELINAALDNLMNKEHRISNS